MSDCVKGRLSVPTLFRPAFYNIGDAMSEAIVEYRIEVVGSEVTVVITASDDGAAHRLADLLDSKFRSGTVEEEEPDE